MSDEKNPKEAAGSRADLLRLFNAMLDRFDSIAGEELLNWRLAISNEVRAFRKLASRSSGPELSSASVDCSGHPIEACRVIGQWNPCDLVGWFDFIEGSWGECGVVRRDGWKIELITGGWRWNEHLIDAMRGHVGWALCWDSSHCGGLHRFEIPESFRSERVIQCQKT